MRPSVGQTADAVSVWVVCEIPGVTATEPMVPVPLQPIRRQGSGKTRTARCRNCHIFNPRLRNTAWRVADSPTDEAPFGSLACNCRHGGCPGCTGKERRVCDDNRKYPPIQPTPWRKHDGQVFGAGHDDEAAFAGNGRRVGCMFRRSSIRHRDIQQGRHASRATANPGRELHVASLRDGQWRGSLRASPGC